VNAKGAGIEAPKALSRVGSAKGCPLSSRLGGLGERRQLPKQGPGRSPGQKRILGVFLAHRTRLADTIGPKLTLFLDDAANHIIPAFHGQHAAGRVKVLVHVKG